jgi:hypothetical protein
MLLCLSCDRLAWDRLAKFFIRKWLNFYLVPKGDSNPLFFSPVFTGFYNVFFKPCVFPRKTKHFAFYTTSTTYTVSTYLRLS